MECHEVAHHAFDMNALIIVDALLLFITSSRINLKRNFEARGEKKFSQIRRCYKLFRANVQNRS